MTNPEVHVTSDNNTYIQDITCSGTVDSMVLLRDFLRVRHIAMAPSTHWMHWYCTLEAHSAYAAVSISLSHLLSFSLEHPHLWLRSSTALMGTEIAEPLIFHIAGGSIMDIHERVHPLAQLERERTGCLDRLMHSANANEMGKSKGPCAIG